MYIKCKKKGALQGDKIETPEFVKENKLEIDYNHYITNQVMKPVQQLFALVLEDMPAFCEEQRWMFGRVEPQPSARSRSH